MTNTIAGNLQTAILVSVLVGLVGCTNAKDQKLPELSQGAGGQATEAERNKVPVPMNLRGQIEFARKDVAHRLNVLSDSVRLSSARQVTWASGALGCPEPGMNYTDALVPGSVIYLQVDNVIYAYHAKIGGEPFYCPRERVEPPVHTDDGDPT